MGTLELGNIIIKYDEHDWSLEQSRKKIIKKIKIDLFIMIAAVLLFALFINIGSRFIDYRISMFLGLAVLMLLISCIEYIVDYVIYKDEIVEYKALDYFSKIKSDNIIADIKTYYVVIRTKKNNKEERLDDLLRRLKCTYRFTYENRYNIKDNTPIKVIIDATRKSIAEIYVTAV